MTFISLGSVILLMSSLSAISIIGCDSLATFNEKHKIALKGKTFDDAFSYGWVLGRGNFGVVKEIHWGDKRAAAKILNYPEHDIIKRIQEREIDILNTMIGLNAAANFYGCAVNEEHKQVYLVQEKLYKDLANKSVALKLRSMPLHKRILRYIKIAEAFQKLHEKNITHQDIKTGNIMAVDNKLSDFRIIDFGLSAKLNEPVTGGSPLLNAPEKVNVKSTVQIIESLSDISLFATFGHDIYALGMTFALMETQLEKIFGDIPGRCVVLEYTPQCFSSIIKNIRDNMKENNQDKLLEIILRAINYDRFKRTGSMEDLKNELIGLYNELSRENNLPPINESNSFNDILKSDANFESEMKAYEVSMVQKEYTMRDANIKEDEKLIQFPMDKGFDELVDDMTDAVKDYFNHLKIDKVLIASHLI